MTLFFSSASIGSQYAANASGLANATSLPFSSCEALDRRIRRHDDLAADAGAGGPRDHAKAEAVALRREEVVRVEEVVGALFGQRVRFLRRLRELQLERHAALLARRR